MSGSNISRSSIPIFLSPKDFPIPAPKMNASSDLETVIVALGHNVNTHEGPTSVPTEKASIDTLSSTQINSPNIGADGFETPTEEELKTLRRVSGQIPWTAYTVAFVELCERFSYYGTTAVCKYCSKQ